MKTQDTKYSIKETQRNRIPFTYILSAINKYYHIELLINLIYGIVQNIWT